MLFWNFLVLIQNMMHLLFRSLGIHWATFKLTVEHYLEPARLLSQYLEKEGIPAADFITVNIGESVVP